MLRWLAIGAAAAFAPPTRPPPRQSALHAETQDPSWKALRPRPGDVVLVDGDNCRGKSKWRLSAAALDACCSSSHARGLLGQETVLMLDHGERRDCFVSSSSGAYATAFAGRRATADDAIVDCVEHFLENNRTLTVVTSDFGLRARASYVAARAIRGAPEVGRRRSPETLVRFARSEAFADAALADATIKPGAHAAAFDEAVDRLAKHVLTAPASVRAQMRRRARPPLVEGSPLGNEQTWMRVVLAERLRWLLAQDAAAPRGPLADFANWFAEAEDLEDAPRVLTHRLTDRKHRHELLRFADALRRPPPPDIVEEEAEEEEDRGEKEARAAVMVAGNRRLRRKRRKRERARKLEGVERGAGASARASAKKLLAESDELEAALRGWLRDTSSPGGGAVAVTAESSVGGGAVRVQAEPDGAFVENPFHSKPGFGGSDALRCICQNPDEPLWPDGHADDDTY